MSSKIGVQNIAHTNGTNAMTVSSGGVTTFTNTPVNVNANAPYWTGRLASNQTLPRVTFTTITGFSTNEIDSSSSFDGTTFTVPSGGAGTYFITGTIYFDWGNVGNDGEDQQTRIVHTPAGGTADTIAMGRYNTGATTNNHDMTQTATVIFPMGVGDTVVIRTFSADNNGAGGGVALANYSNFGGFRIGA